ncbi:hypothetical protein F4860DRAFT_120174 [Xylaria cubensis]|nr:hypothetical protein F4860DRAFT_120174 [Xylaria cubensis]
MRILTQGTLLLGAMHTNGVLLLGAMHTHDITERVLFTYKVRLRPSDACFIAPVGTNKHRWPARARPYALDRRIVRVTITDRCLKIISKTPYDDLTYYIFTLFQQCDPEVPA